jgi:hypothetical protein
VLPGRSFAGKTTLVAALVQVGAEYWSDEYPVLDAEGASSAQRSGMNRRRWLQSCAQRDPIHRQFAQFTSSAPFPIHRTCKVRDDRAYPRGQQANDGATQPSCCSFL